ncbi:cytochrome c [Psychromarinibacter sp. C21-152]|uniref:Cytochrome c n=1 Tax=Psychromarinibacter sediminicola TaxID=3033385 RepID=A0AAE3NSW6_9RHOB|nr:c-type cytochrome [Psychromarinibacter sediminicola]MDF0600330.1 cytochrome c [Psychromarinibacter sediminicola]
MRAVFSIAAILGGVGLIACTSDVETGRDSYVELCSGCHGPAGRGNGPAAASLEVPPADLTAIAARNGGVFPKTEIMAKIDGYAKGQEHHGAMPAFWPLLEGRTVLVETGDGIVTPTPEPLVELTAYLESIQR